MVSNEITFDGSNGPIMSGTWINPKNGDVFTVRDSFFQDNQFIVMTTDGRSLDYNMIQDYIKTEKPEDIKEMKNIFKQNSNSQREQIPSEVLKEIEQPSQAISNSMESMMTEEDMRMCGMISDNSKSTEKASLNIAKDQSNKTESTIRVPFNEYEQVNQIENEDLLFIKRVLKNIEIPNLKVNIDWKSIPTSKLDTLINMLGVDVDNIADWIMKDIDLVRIKNDIKQSICDKIQMCVGGLDEKPKEPTPVKKSSPAVKKTRRSVNEK